MQHASGNKSYIKILGGKRQGKRVIGKLGCRREGNIKMDLEV
jgi:hypothetical protein